MHVLHEGMGERSRAVRRVYVRAAAANGEPSKSSLQCGTRPPSAVYRTGRDRSEGIATWSSSATS
jgi:hypothetical protein